MRKIVFWFCLLFCINSNVSAQRNTVKDPSFLFNSFQRTYTKQVDSAVFYFQHLAAINKPLATDLLHDSFAQNFQFDLRNRNLNDPEMIAYFKSKNMSMEQAKKDQEESEKKAILILNKLATDTSAWVKLNTLPITLWVAAQKNAKNENELKRIGNQYLNYLKANLDVNAERKGRWGLIISNIMSKHPALNKDVLQIRQLIYQQLKDHQVVYDPSAPNRQKLILRSWYRYLFAYTNYLFANELAYGDLKKSEYLKLAFQYSPDKLDLSNRSSFFYDMIFLVEGEKYSFVEDYLATVNNDQEKFNTLFNLSLTIPSYKSKAKQLYKGEQNFQDHWLIAFNKLSPVAPKFTFTQLDGKDYRLGQAKGKWTLIDFWGTWCAPCRKEHPDLEKTYKRTFTSSLGQLDIITIASRDNEKSVKDYMKANNYNFPVIMSDQKIESSYQVQGWPSKYLVSPQGKYLIIPFGEDWVKFIEDVINSD